MKLHIPKHTAPKVVNRLKKKMRIRNKVEGSTDRPRLSIFRSNRNFIAQLIDDTTGKTLLAVSTLKGEKSANKESAVTLGKEIAEKAKKNNITEVVFDRNGYLYHGRVKAFADAAREAGLKF